MISLPMDHC